jgi:hypothetical protein
MQLNTSTKRLFSILFALSLISMNVCLMVQKNTVLESSEINSKRKNKKSTNKSTTQDPVTQTLPSASVQQPIRKPTAPFDAENTISLIQEIGQSILASDNKTQQILIACSQFLSQKTSNYPDLLNNFWINMGNVATNSVQWSNNFYQDVLDSLATKTVLVDNQASNCSSLKVPTNVDSTKIMDKLNQGKYFGGFSTVTPTATFISGMVSHHRDMIRPDTFLNINRASRGQQIIGDFAKFQNRTASVSTPALSAPTSLPKNKKK